MTLSLLRIEVIRFPQREHRQHSQQYPVQQEEAVSVKANPGMAQVQKSSILKIKNEDVVTHLQLNTADGFRKLEIGGMPAGDFSISTSMGSDGEVHYDYESVIDGEVTEANTTGAKEIMTFNIKYDGGSQAISLGIEAEDDTEEKAAERIAKGIDGKTITLHAETTGGGKYKVTASGGKQVTGFESKYSLVQVLLPL